MTVRPHRYKVWLAQAAFDLQIAQISYDSGFYEWTCFQSEQAAEKALKGMMVYCGAKPPKLHKLSVLSKMLRKLRPDMPHESLILDTLQSFTFISRYPFIIPGDNITPHEFITPPDAEECIIEATKVVAYINSIFTK